MTYEEKKKRIARIQKTFTAENTNALVYFPIQFLTEELEKAWAALEFYSTCNDCLYEGEDEMMHADNGERAKEALNE